MTSLLDLKETMSKIDKLTSKLEDDLAKNKERFKREFSKTLLGFNQSKNITLDRKDKSNK